MRILILPLVLWCLIPGIAAGDISSESQSLLPIGALPKNSRITLESANPSATYFTPGEQGYDSLSSKNIYTVKTFESSEPDTSDTADLQALVARKNLMLQKKDLQNFSANCLASSSTEGCILQNDLPVYKSGSFDFLSYFFNSPAQWFRTGADHESDTEIKAGATDTEITESLSKLIDKGNAEVSANGKNITKECDKEKSLRPFTTALGTDKILSCGVDQALQAFRKNRNRIKKDVLIFNDFSHGGTMGRMWLLNSDGRPAQLLEQNPIRVARGPGGFGSGKGSLKTPNGAVLTKAYRPPRAGNIKDGIELVGLEPGNQDIFERGVLLHGWDPYVTTQGCLGIAGTLHTRSQGRRSLGPPPPYLDQLKNNLLKDGGVLIYNFTPDKKAQCK